MLNIANTDNTEGYCFYFDEILFNQIGKVITCFMAECKNVKLLSFPQKNLRLAEFFLTLWKTEVFGLKF